MSFPFYLSGQRTVLKVPKSIEHAQSTSAVLDSIPLSFGGSSLDPDGFYTAQHIEGQQIVAQTDRQEENP